MQVSNPHIQQKPLQAHLHKVCTEGKLGLKHRLRSSFEVQYNLPVEGFLDSGPSITFSTFKCLCVVGAEGDVRISGPKATSLASDGKALSSPATEVWLPRERKK